MQRAVLKEEIAPADVALYWFEQDGDGAVRVREITVNADATLKGWLPGEFEQESELSHEILDLRWQRQGRDDHLGG
jgi:hypothetical protein